MSSTRRCALLATVAASLLLAVAPGRSGPRTGGVIRTMIGEPASLDPARARTVYEYAVVVQVFSRLVEIDPSLSLRPSLARSWTVSPDGRVYTFALAEARFHDGREVGAADVAGSLKRLLAPGVAGPYTELLSVVEGARDYNLGKAADLGGVRVLGPRAVEIRLEEPYAPLLGLLTAPSLSIVPAPEAERPGDAFGKAPIGSGPFRLERWEPGRQIDLRAHEAGPEGRPLLEGATFLLLERSAAAHDQILSGLLRNALDYVFVPRGLSVEAQEKPPGYKRQSHPELAVFYIGFNLSGSGAVDPRIRKGVRLALDRRQLARDTFTDPDRVTDAMIPFGLLGPRREAPPPDPAAARALFGELAARGRRPRLRLHFTASRGLELGFEALASRFASLGLDLVLSREPSLAALQVSQEQGRVEAWFGGVQADFPDPDGLMRSLFHSRPRGGNWFGYASPEVDRLLDAARATAELGERARLYAQVEEALARDVPAIPLWGRTYQYFVGGRVRGLELSHLPFQIHLHRVWMEER